MKPSHVIATPGVWRPLAYLALPVLLEQLLSLLVGLVDTWLTGHFVPGEAPMAAIGLMAYVLWLLPNIFASIAIGATALVARFVGAGDAPLACRTMNQAVLCGCLLAVIVTLGFGWLADAFVSGMGLVEESHDLAVRYLRYLVPVIPAIMIIRVGIACLRGAGDTFSGFVAMSVVNMVNVVVSAALVTGFAGLPTVGWDAMAIGTAVGHVIGALIVLGLLLRGRAGLRLNRADFVPDGNLIRRLLRIGLPGGADILTVLTCHLCFVRMINGLGTLASSAHMLAVRVESIAYLPGTAFQVAASTMAGQCLGAQQPQRAMRGVRAACVTGIVVMGAAGLLFYFGAGWLTEFFTGSATNPTAAAAAPLLKLASISMPAMALAMVLSGALRGAGDTRWPLAITLIGFLFVRIPGAWYLLEQQRTLPVLGWMLPVGVMGAWLATVLDLYVRAGLATARFWHGGWKSTQV